MRAYALWFALLLFGPIAPLNAEPGSAAGLDRAVVKMPLGSGVSFDDAVEAMKIRANSLNIRLVGELPLSRQLEAMGEKTRRMEIYQFCDPVTAKKMVEAEMAFAAYLPCRITLVEDAQGRGWLVMTDLDPLIDGAALPPDLEKEAVRVRDVLHEIMQAGAAGEW